MKKIIISLIALICLILPASVLASGSITASTTSMTVEVGSSKTFTITAKNAIGDVSISSSNASIAKTNVSSWETGSVGENETKTGTITVTGVSEGTATITLTIDGATFDDEPQEISGQKTITVTVTKKAVTPVETPKSTNNNLKDISIIGYNLIKVNSNNYTLSVGPDVKSVAIKATAEDNKATVTGSGVHNLVAGENRIEVTITSESGLKNTIIVIVTKNTIYNIDNLDTALDNNINTIALDNDTLVTSQDFQKIKASNKTINLSYTEDDKELYYWLIDGTQITGSKSLLTTIDFNSENKSVINTLSNYANGVLFSVKQNNDIPEWAVLRVNVSDKYSNGESVNIYKYTKSSNKLELVKDKVKVDNGFVQINDLESADYLITMATIATAKEDSSTNKKDDSSEKVILPILIAICLVILMIVSFLIISKREKNKQKNKPNNVIDNKNLQSPDFVDKL